VCVRYFRVVDTLIQARQ